MVYKFLHLVVHFFFVTSCFGMALEKHESAVLEDFFRCMVEESEGGYVLYGKKPVCITGYHVLDSFYGESEHHKQIVRFTEGAKCLNKIQHLLKNDNLIIHVYDGPEALIENWIHILFLNKELFLTTVKENLILFQYVLGPEVTPEKLLEKLTDRKENFHKVLKYDEVLIGIVLGYGTQNALRGGRVENMQKKLTAAEEVPFKNPVYEQEDSLKLCKNILLQIPASNLKGYKLDVGFSYNSLKEEFNEIFQKMVVSSEKLENERPNFIFGRLKEDKETVALIDELEKTQTKIQDLLKSEDFFKTMLQSFFQENAVWTVIESSKNPLSFNQKLPELIAANIWENLYFENESYVEGFFEGMKDANKEKPDFRNSNYHILKQLTMAQANIEAADDFFSELEKKEDIKPLYPKKVYYSILQEGDGLTLEDQTRVSLHCGVKTPNNKVLCDTFSSGQPLSLDLTKTIDGFRLGTRGMKVGEIREIFIHPSVGYGIYTTMEKGIYLKARVELVSIDSNDMKIPSNISPFDFTKELALLKNVDFATISKQEGYLSGQKVWSHYQKGLSISADDMITLILRLKSDELWVDLDDPSNQDLINKLHWNIYKELG